MNPAGTSIRMNTLDIEISTDDFPTFCLLVDGKPMADWLVDGNDEIPFWLVADGLPTWSYHKTSTDADVRIVTVCGCGEEGCGHSRCTVKREGDTVVFEDFQGDVGAEAQTLRLVFRQTDYDAVTRAINEAKDVYSPPKT